MKPSQPQLPFSTAPIDWLEPLAFKFHQLRDVSAAAERAGWRIYRLKVLGGGYEAHFTRKPAIAAPEAAAGPAEIHLREPSPSPAAARTTASPENL